MDNFSSVRCRGNSSSKFIIERMAIKTERTKEDEVDENDLKPDSTNSRKRPYSSLSQHLSGETTTVPPSKVVIPYCRPSTLEDKGSSDEEYFEDSSSLALVLSESSYEEDTSSSVPPSARESETECDIPTDLSVPVSLTNIGLSAKESVDQREPISSSHKEAFGFLDLSTTRPNGAPTRLVSDEISNIQGTSATLIPIPVAKSSAFADHNIHDNISNVERTPIESRILDPVRPLDHNCDRSEALESTSYVEQKIADTVVNDVVKVAASDTMISYSCERIEATNITEDVRSETSVQTQSSYSLPIALSIPLDMPSKDLRLIEINVLKYAMHLKETVAAVEEEKKELDMKRMQVQQLLENQRTEYSAKKKAIHQLVEKLKDRVKMKQQCTEERDTLAATLVDIKNNLDCKVESLRDLETLLFRDEMVALADSAPKCSLSNREAEVSILNGEISKMKKNLLLTQQAVDDAESKLKKSDDETQMLRTVISGCQEKAERIGLELANEERTFDQLSDQLNELENKCNASNFNVIEIEKIISIIQLAYKVNKLESKQKAFSVPNERLVVVLHDGQLLLQSQMATFIDVTGHPVQNTSADGRSYSLPNALSIPIETTHEVLDQLESELQKYAADLKETMSAIDEGAKELARKRMQVKQSFENQRTECSAKKEAIKILEKKLEESVETKRQCTDKRDELAATAIEAKRKFDWKEKSLGDLENLLFMDEISAVADSVTDGSLMKILEQKKTEVSVLKEETSELKQTFKSAQEAVNDAENALKKAVDKIQALRTVISCCEEKTQQITLEQKKNRETFRQLSDRWNDFKEKFNNVNFNLVELDKIGAKIQLLRKLKKLEIKQEIYSVPNERLFFALHEGQLRFSSQPTPSISSMFYPVWYSADGRSFGNTVSSSMRNYFTETGMQESVSSGSHQHSGEISMSPVFTVPLNQAASKEKVSCVKNLKESSLSDCMETISSDSPPICENIMSSSASESAIVSCTETALMPPNSESGAQGGVSPSEPIPNSEEEILNFIETFSPSSFGGLLEQLLSDEAMDNVQGTSSGTPIPHPLTVDWNSDEEPTSEALEPSASAGPSIPDEAMDTVRDTSNGTPIPDPVTRDPSEKPTASEAFEPSALAGPSIHETSIHDDGKVVGNDANSSCEPITTIATNITEDVRPGTSTQMELPSTSSNPISSPLDTVNEAVNELPIKLPQSAALPAESRRRSQRIRSQQSTLMINNSTDEESFFVEPDDVPYHPTAGPSQSKQKYTRKSNRLAFKHDQKLNVDDKEEPLKDKDSKNVAQNHPTSWSSRPKFPSKYTKKDRDRPFKCDKCNKSYVDKRDLDHHEKSRCGVDKPLSCSECGRQFGVMYSLRKHLVVMHGVNRSQFAAFGAGYKIRPVYPHKCEKCQRTFKNQYWVNFHSKYCGLLEPAFHCTHCSYRTNFKADLKRHLFKIHRVSSA